MTRVMYYINDVYVASTEEDKVLAGLEPKDVKGSTRVEKCMDGTREDSRRLWIQLLTAHSLINASLWTASLRHLRHLCPRTSSS
jgi:hypothetical protein